MSAPFRAALVLLLVAALAAATLALASGRRVSGQEEGHGGLEAGEALERSDGGAGGGDGTGGRQESSGDGGSGAAQGGRQESRSDGGSDAAGGRQEPGEGASDGAGAQRVPRVAERIRWRRSVAVGAPAAGRLVRGVRLPSEGRDFFTWDPVRRRSPNRSWRRWGTDRMIRLVLTVARQHRRAHPRSPRMAIGDISRPRGGDFGPQFGFVGHASHQNGLDVDVYYPRLDRRERAPRRDARGIDRRLSQALVDRFLAHGAEVIFVGPNTGLRGPAGRVQILLNHDNHMHVRLPSNG